MRATNRNLLRMARGGFYGPFTRPRLAAMLNAAFYLLTIAVVFGALLAVLHMRDASAAIPPWPLAALHALAALTGFGLLLVALQGPPRGLDQGTGSFGTIAAALFVVAAMFGGGLLAARLRGRRAGSTLIGIHAMLAVTGLVILMAYVYA